MNRLIKILHGVNPVLSLFVVTISTGYYHYFNDEYLEIYTLLSNVFGFSLLWVIAGFESIRWSRYCNYTKVALIGLVFYCSINIFYSISKLYGIDISGKTYITAFEVIGLIGISIIDTILILQHFINGKRESH